jgi:hypothetical protein
VCDQPLSYHARYLPRDVVWHADPSGPGTICELRCAGFTIQKADNAQDPGISAVQTRIEAGTLKIVGNACPNLLAESALYYYEPGSDKPAKESDHAMDALRYLIFKLDAKRLVRKKWFWQGDKKDQPAEPPRQKVKRPRLKRVERAAVDEDLLGEWFGEFPAAGPATAAAGRPRRDLERG